MAEGVEEERRLALDRLRQLAQFYERPEAAGLMQQMSQRASGADAPYTQDVTNSMYADNADASAGQVRNERGLIDRAFGNAGLSGSGLQMSARINSQRRASALARQGRRDITSRASLANYQAREQAQGQVQNYLSQIQGAQERAGMAEVDFRGQAREVSDAPAQPAAPQQQSAPQTPVKDNGLGTWARSWEAERLAGAKPRWTGGGEIGLNNYNQEMGAWNQRFQQGLYQSQAQAAMLKAFQ